MNKAIETVRSGDQINIGGRWLRVHGVSNPTGGTVIVNRNGHGAETWTCGELVEVR